MCDRWIQEGTTNRRGRSHPPPGTTSREDWQILRMAVTDRSVTSRTIAQHIESAMHQSVSTRTIRLRLQLSGLSAPMVAWSTLDAEPQTSPLPMVR
ncbi:HTH_Tnp_Tc3_2 domain-containing protein [Trichonephila clavipes]|uniref:HTH_Tnp_Tc3_2 domain-containing protein n=1 Tax=Trichonephila clavipes TaxID=2585209 RepID=A0A8X6W2J8_TRICX|nr:HTH_Tnp_Tc3_2 domain-containing protein [Trichonephila clavipes]